MTQGRLSFSNDDAARTLDVAPSVPSRAGRQLPRKDYAQMHSGRRHLKSVHVVDQLPLPVAGLLLGSGLLYLPLLKMLLNRLIQSLKHHNGFLV